MPSSLPRLSVVVTPEQHQLLLCLATLQNRSASSYVRDLIELATPALTILRRKLDDVVDQEEVFEDDFREDLAEMLLEADEEIQQELELFYASEPTAPEDAGEPPAAREDGRAGGLRPPYSNTGVRNPEQGGSSVLPFSRKAV